MGTWGAGIFDDDIAMDIRASFEDALDEGLDVSAATAAVLDEYDDILLDPDEGPLVYLALAALQMERRALQPAIRARAIGIIDDGVGLDRWLDSGEEALRERQTALDELRTLLASR